MQSVVNHAIDNTVVHKNITYILPGYNYNYKNSREKIIVACASVPMVQEHRLQSRKELFRELCLLPGYFFTITGLIPLRYLHKNFVDYGKLFLT